MEINIKRLFSKLEITINPNDTIDTIVEKVHNEIIGYVDEPVIFLGIMQFAHKIAKQTNNPVLLKTTPKGTTIEYTNNVTTKVFIKKETPFEELMATFFALQDIMRNYDIEFSFRVYYKGAVSRISEIYNSEFSYIGSAYDEIFRNINHYSGKLQVTIPHLLSHIDPRYIFYRILANFLDSKTLNYYTLYILNTTLYIKTENGKIFPLIWIYFDKNYNGYVITLLRNSFVSLSSSIYGTLYYYNGVTFWEILPKDITGIVNILHPQKVTITKQKPNKENKDVQKPKKVHNEDKSTNEKNVDIIDIISRVDLI